jgi:hypothetical protein
MFSTKETADEPKGDGAKQESHEWFWHLRHGQLSGPSMRVLEETEAAEGLPMVPQDALDAIIALRNDMDLATKIGLTVYKTNRLIFNVPRESTAMTALAAIAEEGAYVANEPAFALLPLTVVKYGSMITATRTARGPNLFGSGSRSLCPSVSAAQHRSVHRSQGERNPGDHSATFVDADIMTWIYAAADPLAGQPRPS